MCDTPIHICRSTLLKLFFIVTNPTLAAKILRNYWRSRDLIDMKIVTGLSKILLWSGWKKTIKIVPYVEGYLRGMDMMRYILVIQLCESEFRELRVKHHIFMADGVIKLDGSRCLWSRKCHRLYSSSSNVLFRMYREQ